MTRDEIAKEIVVSHRVRDGGRFIEVQAGLRLTAMRLIQVNDIGFSASVAVDHAKELAHLQLMRTLFGERDHRLVDAVMRLLTMNQRYVGPDEMDAFGAAKRELLDAIAPYEGWNNQQGKRS